MKEETLGKIFEFIKEKSKQNLPLFWKLKNDIPLTEEDLNIKGDLHLSDRNITSLPLSSTSIRYFSASPWSW